MHSEQDAEKGFMEPVDIADDQDVYVLIVSKLEEKISRRHVGET